MKVLSDRAVLLTEGLGSLGRAQAVTLARAGARALVLDRPEAEDGSDIVAELVLFLVSPASDMISGQNIAIDGCW